MQNTFNQNILQKKPLSIRFSKKNQPEASERLNARLCTDDESFRIVPKCLRDSLRYNGYMQCTDRFEDRL
jgi:hypothetical protein